MFRVAVIELVAGFILVLLFLLGVARLDDARDRRRLAIAPPCDSLYAIARTSSDSLYVAMNRASCATR